MTHNRYPFFKYSLNRRYRFYFTAYRGEIEWMTLSGWLSNLEELSGAAEGYCWKVICFGETIELRLKSMIFRVGFKPSDSSCIRKPVAFC
jgi:hypothetical protein